MISKNDTLAYKRALSVLLAAALVFNLSACGTAEGITEDKIESSEVSSTLCNDEIVRAAKSLPDTAEANLETELEPDTDAVEAVAEVEINMAETIISVPIYAAPEVSEVIANSVPEQDFAYIETENPLWFSVTLSEGKTGYIYGEQLFRLDENGQPVAKSLAEESLDATIETLKSKLPEGKYWNHYGQDLAWGEESPFTVTDTPCYHSTYGFGYCNFYNGASIELFSYGGLRQCLGFASFLSDQLFGIDAPLHIFYDPDLLRVGDHIRLGDYEHSMTVIDMNDEYVTLGEVNQNYEDCKISWSRQMYWSEIYALNWDAEYISRYPLCPDENGGFTQWS